MPHALMQDYFMHVALHNAASMDVKYWAHVER